MSPQEEVSGPTSVTGSKKSLSPVCVEVRMVMDAIRDNRATVTDRAFVVAHTENCAGCASEWVFLQATKAAWANTPMAVPSASLAARIAAATYRKPTFAERLVSAFAFLNPVPMRVAIGVAAVVGVSFLALPRLTIEQSIPSPTIHEPAPSIANNTPEDQEKPLSAATTPPAKVIPPAVKKTVASAVVSSLKDKFVASRPSASKPVVSEVVAQEPIPARTVATREKMVTPKLPTTTNPKNTLVAFVKPKPVRETPMEPVVSSVPDTKPSVGENTNHIAATVTPSAPVEPVSNPEAKLPAANPVATVAGMRAPETDPGFANGTTRISLSNTNKRSSIAMSGRASLNPPAGSPDAFLVAAPMD